jgi:hypothetical protein
MKDVPNAYCIIHFACCREIKTISEQEKAVLAKQVEEKLFKEL